MDAVCNYLTVLPDLGWYTPQRVSDPAIGIPSVEPQEDIVILSDKKSEVLSLLRNTCRSATLDFSDRITLRAFAQDAVSLVPAPQLSFTCTRSDAGDIAAEADASALNLRVPNGEPLPPPSLLNDR